MILFICLYIFITDMVVDLTHGVRASAKYRNEAPILYRNSCKVILML